MTEHTPTPWHLGASKHSELVMGFKNNSECIVAELDDDLTMAEIQANAAFIVEAVNNHDALKARVKELEEALRGVEQLAVRHVKLVRARSALQEGISK